MVNVETIRPVCPRCDIKMDVGLGINPTTPDCFKNALRGPEVHINVETLSLDYVWKCSNCGHSNDILFKEHK